MASARKCCGNIYGEIGEMKRTIEYFKEELARIEFRKFLEDGLQDVKNKQLLEFDKTFDELEKRYINS